MSKQTPKVLKKSVIIVQDSPIHGRGVFAKEDIKKGECIIEYKGERISWKKALDRHPHDLDQPNHTFYFSLSNGKVIDGKVRGNESKWINHSCAPNCLANELNIKDDKLRVFLFAKKNIKAGEELFYDYNLDVEGKKTKAVKKDYLCRCGKKKCRGTMLCLK
jgi:SET domain-containing protein